VKPVNCEKTVFGGVKFTPLVGGRGERGGGEKISKKEGLLQLTKWTTGGKRKTRKA